MPSLGTFKEGPVLTLYLENKGAMNGWLAGYYCSDKVVNYKTNGFAESAASIYCLGS